MTIGDDRPQPGDRIEDFTLLDDRGQPWSLSDHAGTPTLLIFHRHLMWLPCQEHLLAVSERLDDFPPARIAVVAFAPVAQLADHRRHLDLPLPLLADPQRALYRQFGLGRGSLTEVWGLSTLRLYRDLLRKGRRLRRPTQDTRQLGGDFVIDSNRVLVAAFRPRSPDSRPSVDDLVSAVSRAG